MQKKTLLEIVQDVLLAMSSDEVSSIDETTESIQVAEITRTVYEEWTTRDDWPFEKALTRLQALSDLNKPNYFKLQDAIFEINQDYIDIKYEVTVPAGTERLFKDIKYMSPKEFLEMCLKRDTSDTANIKVVTDFSGVALFIEKTKDPEFWTSFDDDYVIFDSYNVAKDTTLQESKSICYAVMAPAWQRTNTFIPEMPSKMFPSFIAQVKSDCFIYMKDQASPNDEKRILRGMSAWRRKAGRANNDKPRNTYGRR